MKNSWCKIFLLILIMLFLTACGKKDIGEVKTEIIQTEDEEELKKNVDYDNGFSGEVLDDAGVDFEVVEGGMNLECDTVEEGTNSESSVVEESTNSESGMVKENMDDALNDIGSTTENDVEDNAESEDSKYKEKEGIIKESTYEGDLLEPPAIGSDEVL